MDLKDSASEGSMGSLEPSSIQMFANTSSLHGIRHIFVYGPVTIRRLLWTMAFVGSLGLLLVESSDRVAFYFSYQHVTKMDEVVAHSLVFPAVTLCNLNAFRFSRLTTNDLYHAGELLALLDVNLQIPEPQLADPAVLAALQDKANFKQYKPKMFNMQEFLGRVGHDLKDMLLYCKFKGQECSRKDFKTVSMARVPASFLFSGCAAGLFAGAPLDWLIRPSGRAVACCRSCDLEGPLPTRLEDSVIRGCRVAVSELPWPADALGRC
uniref:Acid-sensing ion channel 2 n=1 Tax=Chelydra serpentina TaxID=8475 RepID=A0A8C3RXT0_CHESE